PTENQCAASRKGNGSVVRPPKGAAVSIQTDMAALHANLGHKPQTCIFAKLEILVGLCAVSAGLWLSARALSPMLFVLGGYLALAGHRSHIYQSNNELAQEIRSLKHLLSHRRQGTKGERAQPDIFIEV